MTARGLAIATIARLLLTVNLIVWVALGSRVALVITLALICAAIEIMAWVQRNG